MFFCETSCMGPKMSLYSPWNQGWFWFLFNKNYFYYFLIMCIPVYFGWGYACVYRWLWRPEAFESPAWGVIGELSDMSAGNLTPVLWRTVCALLSNFSGCILASTSCMQNLRYVPLFSSSIIYSFKSGVTILKKKLLFAFWDFYMIYIYIISPLPLLHPMCHHPSQLPLKFMASYSFIFIVTYTHTNLEIQYDGLSSLVLFIYINA